MTDRRPWRRKDRRDIAEDIRHDNRHFPCPNCGADLRFHPGSAKMQCTHCEAQIAVPHIDDAAAQVEKSYLMHLEENTAMPEIEVQSLNCNTCAASVEFDADEHSRQCPFCDSVIVADVTTQRKIVPQGLLPFRVMEAEAHDSMKAWLTSRWFAPNGFEGAAAKESFSGIYVPLWTYDSAASTDYRGQRGRYTGSGKNRRISWTNVSGTVRSQFDDVLVSGTKTVSAEFKDALGPWSFYKLETYQTEFLAGFRAENHTVGLEDGFFNAQEFMRVKIADEIRSDIGGARQRILSSTSTFSKMTFKHVLIPVWITHYSFGQERYRLNVNGHSGKTYGGRPFSKIKLLIGSLTATVGSMGVGYALSLASGG